MISRELLAGFLNITIGHVVMLGVGGLLIYLAVRKGIEPLLLLPIGVGALLANIPVTGMGEEGGVFWLLKRAGLETELFPLLIFVGIGAMIDFGPLLERPYTILLGAAAQFGIFGAMLVALLLGFPIREAASIGVIGSADGPTSIYVSSQLAPHLLGPVAVAAYSYMALVPIIQPPIMRLLTTSQERKLRMPAPSRVIPKTVRVLFPVVSILLVGIIAPKATPLIGMLMFGNLLRESGVVERLSATAQNELANMVTILLGITVGSTMAASTFLRPDTLLIFSLGIVAFAMDTAAGVMLGRLFYLLSGKRINPLIGAAGISAFPMSARVVQREGLKANPYNHLLMHAAGANTAGQIASVVAGGALLALVAGL